MLSLLLIIATISVLVVVHEGGHFFVARWCGVRVLTFSVGFGKPLWRRTGASGTEYMLAMIPLGGYVRMLDSRFNDLSVEDAPYAFDLKNVWQRIAIVAAGPIINLLFAAGLYAVIEYAGERTLLPVTGTPIVESIAANAGLPYGQQIVAIDSIPVNDWDSINRQLLQRIGDTGHIVLTTQSINLPDDSHSFFTQDSQSSSAVYHLPINNWLAEETSQAPTTRLGIMPWQPPIPIRINQVIADSPAQGASLQVDDVITFLNNEPMSEYAVFVKRIRSMPDAVVNLTVERQDRTLDVRLKLDAHRLEDGSTIGRIGLSAYPPVWPDNLLISKDVTLLQAISQGFIEVGELIRLMINFLGQMVTGKVSSDYLSGPITIAQVAADSASYGWLAFISFLAYLSVSLGVLNLLPIPTLDGGHLLFYTIELFTRKPVSIKWQSRLMRVGMAIIFGFMAIAISNDFIRIWG